MLSKQVSKDEENQATERVTFKSLAQKKATVIPKDKLLYLGMDSNRSETLDSTEEYNNNVFAEA